MDNAIDVLHEHGLKIVLGTPTATPPKWLVDAMPDMLAVDESGNPRGFGSRRHYCFSHRGFQDECARIVTALCKRYGNHPALIAWQTDNEYGCHDTILSYSKAALLGFRDWLAQKYQSPNALNKAWGNISQHGIPTQLDFLDRDTTADDNKVRYLGVGDPDLQAFHHDLYRACGQIKNGVDDGRWWVMEQQPGPVNWAPYNPAPFSGAVRLWAWEAFAAGAEIVSENVHTLMKSKDGHGAFFQAENCFYLAGRPDPSLADHVVRKVLKEANIKTHNLHRDIRIRDNGNVRYIFNYGPEMVDCSGLITSEKILMGQAKLEPRGVLALSRIM
ncbi:Beta-galactosidase [Nymphon striatum]|nr:Beta-galactosidase [Nymphon striatum]